VTIPAPGTVIRTEHGSGTVAGIERHEIDRVAGSASFNVVRLLALARSAPGRR
jgi:hypothetical protein